MNREKDSLLNVNLKTKHKIVWLNVTFIKYLCIVFLFFFNQAITYGQQRQVNGILKNNTGDVVVHANVMLKNSKGYIIKFVNSDNEGKYLISIPDTIRFTSLFVEISYLGYKKVQQQLTANKFSYNFLLEEQTIDLKEVQVRSKPQIISIGDTLSYDVSSFARPEDRSIGDVIKRLPGITVDEKGQISYNGKAITNLYIHGDDLMDGRYGLATKAISKDMIKSVDVMQHHQPIKVLKDKVFTDDVAMNLVLKDENSLKLAGQAMLGTGLPEQFDGAFNVMTFNKKFKMLNSLKANNSGVDFRDDFAQLGIGGFVKDVNNDHPNSLLSAGTVGKPDLPRGNYYLNKSGIVNANNLFNFKGGLQLKSNVQVFLDKNILNYASRVDNYLPNDTLTYSELQNTIHKPRAVNTSLTTMVNKDSYFLNNKLSLIFGTDNNVSDMDFNNLTFDQNLNGHTHNFSNDFSFTPSLKNKNIIDIRWYINYYNNPQNLYINSGINKDVLNSGIAYLAVNQSVKIPSFFNNAMASYRILNEHLIKQNYQIGMMNERQQLKSELSLIQLDGNVTNYKDDVGNDLTWQRDRFYFNAEYFLKKETWEASLSVPLISQFINYKQDEYDLSKSKNQFFINPKLRFKLFLNSEDYLLLNYSIDNSVGNVTNVYKGAILTNYRSIYANAADLQEQYASGSGLYYNFQRSVIMLFANAGINYKKVTANSILSTILSNNIQRTILLPYENDQSSLTANASISKFLFMLNTTASIRSSWSRTNYNQFINSQQLPFSNDNLSLTAGIESKFFGSVTFSYTSVANWNSSKQKAVGNVSSTLSNQTKRFDQNISLGYSPMSNLFFTLQGRQIYSNQASVSAINYLFLDTKMRYKFVKWRTDFEFDITNLANVKEYEVFSLSSNQFIANRYEIRGRMAILRATFNL